MIKLLNDKYDSLVNKILYIAYFIHQLFFLFSVSAFAREVAIVRKFANFVIIGSFFIMGLTVVYYFFKKKFSLKEICIYILIAIPLLISLYNYRVVMVISNLLYIAVFKNADGKKGMKIALYATILGFVINVFISIFTKYTGDCIQYRHGIDFLRHGMGFYYATIGSFYFLTIALMLILVEDKLKIWHYLIIIVCAIIIFILTDTKAPLAYTFLALLLYLLLVQYKNEILEKIFGIFTIISFPCATILTLFLSYTYNADMAIYSAINSILTGRLYLTYNALQKCGWTIFGQNPGIWGEGYYIDSSIVSMLVQNGLIVLIMSIIFMTFYSYMAVKTRNKKLMVVLMIIALRSTFDFGFMTMQLCPVVILFYIVWNDYVKIKGGLNARKN